MQETESVFCYVNSVFAPGLDEGVGNLWRVSSLARTVLPLAIWKVMGWAKVADCAKLEMGRIS